MKEKVLITGASGFLGYHIINAAIENNLEIYAAVRKSSDITHLKHLPIHYQVLNFADVDSMTAIFSEIQFDYVIHAAGTTKANSEREYDLVNNVFTNNLALAASKSSAPVKRFVFISSLAACGPVKNDIDKIKEALQPNPVTAYGKSKLNAELNLKKIDIPVTILRPTAIYGPREKDIFIVTQNLKKGIDLYIGKKSQKLSFVYAKDMAALAVNALSKPNADGIFNITDGNEYNRYAYADIVKEILGKKAVRLHLPVALVKLLLFGVEKISKLFNKVPTVSNEKLNELMAENWTCDISKARQELNFNPTYNLQDGLKESVEWYKKNNWL